MFDHLDDPDPPTFHARARARVATHRRRLLRRRRLIVAISTSVAAVTGVALTTVLANRSTVHLHTLAPSISPSVTTGPGGTGASSTVPDRTGANTTMPAQTSSSTTTSSATTSFPALRAVEAPDFAVAYFVPASWTSTPYNSIYAGGAEDGTTGYVVIEAGGFLTNSIPEACHELATNNVLHPYGLAPRVETATVAGRSSCFVWPSLDSVSQPSRLNGPHFQMAAAVIPYAHPRIISGADTYRYLEIIADPLHVRAIADSVVFLGGY